MWNPFRKTIPTEPDVILAHMIAQQMLLNPKKSAKSGTKFFEWSEKKVRVRFDHTRTWRDEDPQLTVTELIVDRVTVSVSPKASEVLVEALRKANALAEKQERIDAVAQEKQKAVEAIAHILDAGEK